MKQIFDWMRERLEELLREPSYRHNGDDFNTGIVDAESILDEAEAKWESDVCEWENPKNCKHIFKSHDKIVADNILLSWRFCPYCGKPIKIAEVW